MTPEIDPTVLAHLTELIAAHLAVDINKVVPDASIVDDLGADSLDTVELVMRAEEQYKIELPEEDVEQTHTVGQFAALVTRLRREEQR
jgi:acyl carrier protein